jgi:hypothetical protein
MAEFSVLVLSVLLVKAFCPRVRIGKRRAGPDLRFANFRFSGGLGKMGSAAFAAHPERPGKFCPSGENSAGLRGN